MEDRYTIAEKVIKQGDAMLRFKQSEFFGPLKDIIEADIRLHLAVFLDPTCDEDQVKDSRSKAVALKSLLETIDSKISDMNVWLQAQQKKAERDMDHVDDILNYHRSQREGEKNHAV